MENRKSHEGKSGWEGFSYNIESYNWCFVTACATIQEENDELKQQVLEQNLKKI